MDSGSQSSFESKLCDIEDEFGGQMASPKDNHRQQQEQIHNLKPESEVDIDDVEREFMEWDEESEKQETSAPPPRFRRALSECPTESKRASEDVKARRQTFLKGHANTLTSGEMKQLKVNLDACVELSRNVVDLPNIQVKFKVGRFARRPSDMLTPSSGLIRSATEPPVEVDAKPVNRCEDCLKLPQLDAPLFCVETSEMSKLEIDELTRQISSHIETGFETMTKTQHIPALVNRKRERKRSKSSVGEFLCIMQ